MMELNEHIREDRVEKARQMLRRGIGVKVAVGLAGLNRSEAFYVFREFVQQLEATKANVKDALKTAAQVKAERKYKPQQRRLEANKKFIARLKRQLGL